MATLKDLPRGQIRTLRLTEDPETHSLVPCQNGDAPLVTFSFQPGALTTALQSSLVRALRAYEAVQRGDESAAKDVDPMVAENILLAVITDWDVESTPGEKLPITSEGLAELGFDVIGAFLGVILQEVNPGKARPSLSNGSSAPEGPSTTESSDTLPAGI